MSKKNKTRFDSFFPKPVVNPFGETEELSAKKRVILNVERMYGSSEALDFFNSEVAEGCVSTPFPSWNVESEKESPEMQTTTSTAPTVQQKRGKTMDGDAVYEYDVALHLAKHYPTGLYQGIPYIKIDGVDVPLDNRLVGSLIEKSMPMYQKRKVSARNFPHIQSWLQAILDGEGRTLQRDPHLIRFQNACVNFLTGEIVPEAKLKKKFFPVRINASYFPDEPQDTPVWDKFLEDCSGGDPEIKQVLLEFVAYMLAPCDPDQVILMAPTASSGKSVLGNFTRELLGFNKTCAIALSNFGKAFEVSQIYGKVANFCLDISGMVLPDAVVATVKRLSGAGDPETINAKYKDPFPYINYAKLVFACNEGGLRLRNPDSGFERRLVVLPFLYATPKHKMDKQLREKLWAERDGIVQQAMNVLKGKNGLYRRGFAFSYCAEGEKLKRKYMGVSEPSVQDFIDECCILSPEERAWTSTMYEEYLSYCQKSGVEPVGRKKFSQIIYSVPSVRQRKFQENLTQLQGAEGIGLKG